MQPVAVAKRYARALADYVEGKRKGPARLEAVAGELALVSRALLADPRFPRFFADPSIPLADKHKAIDGLAHRTGLTDELRNFLTILVTNRRLGAIGSIQQAFETIKNERLGSVAAETTTAVPLSAAELRKLKAALEKLTGREVTIEPRVDPAVLGGVLTRIGSKVYDGTLRHQLDTLRARLIGSH